MRATIIDIGNRIPRWIFQSEINELLRMKQEGGNVQSIVDGLIWRVGASESIEPGRFSLSVDKGENGEEILSVIGTDWFRNTNAGG